MTEREVFEAVVKFMDCNYPHRAIRLRETCYGDIVSIDGEDKFNTEGWTLLYNLQRLCKELEDELQ